MPGVETSLPLMLTQAKLGKCTIAQVANWMSNAPVKAYGITNQGLITVDYDADLIVVDWQNYRSVSGIRNHNPSVAGVFLKVGI